MSRVRPRRRICKRPLPIKWTIGLDASFPFFNDYYAASDRAIRSYTFKRASRRPDRVIRAGRRLVKVGASGRLGRTTWILLGGRDFVGSVREDTNFVVA